MTASSSSAVSADPIAVAVRSIHTMADGDRASFDFLYHPHAASRENGPSPPSRVPGPAGFYSTALWLRAAFAGLHYDIHHTLADDNLVAVNSTMNGRHVAPWAVYAGDGEVDTVFPATNKTFAATQSHWFRIEDGKIIEHWANRDDIGMSKQLGWIPPTPAYLLKMARAKRRQACVTFATASTMRQAAGLPSQVMLSHQSRPALAAPDPQSARLFAIGVMS